MPGYHDYLKTLTPTPPREPRSLYHPQPQLFTNAGENLIFEIAGGIAGSLPRVHLIYAECQGNRLRFRFPLHQVEVSVIETMRLPVNLATSKSLHLLENILSGEVSVLYAGKSWVDEPPAHACEVQAIDFRHLIDQPKPRS